jgi:hypothetical protein
MILLKTCATRTNLVTVTLFVLVLCLLAGSCSGGGKEYVDMMAMVPVGSTEYHFWAVDKLGADGDLSSLYRIFRDSEVARQVGDVEPVLAVVKKSAKASGFGGSVSVLRGDFNFRDLERRMQNQGYVQSMHRDVAIWTLGGNGDGRVSVALWDHAVLMGRTEALKASIDVMKLDQEDSLDEDQTISWVTDRLPEGLIVDVVRAGLGSEESYTDLISYGRSYSKAGEDQLRMTVVYVFKDGYAAGPAQNGIRDYLTGKGYANVETKQEGNVIRATGLIYISDFAQSISY